MTAAIASLGVATNTLGTELGFESISRAAYITLRERLNDELDRQAARWLQPDLAFQTDYGDDVGQIELEHVTPANFYTGPQRTLITAPLAAFPNVSCFIGPATGAPVQFDSFDSFTMRLVIEGMVKVGPVEEGQEQYHEAVLFRRNARMAEAIHAVLMTNSNLYGLVQSPSDPPRALLGDTQVVKRDEKGRNPRYFWQGSRLEYAMPRHVRF